MSGQGQRFGKRVIRVMPSVGQRSRKRVIRVIRGMSPHDAYDAYDAFSIVLTSRARISLRAQSSTSKRVIRVTGQR